MPTSVKIIGCGDAFGSGGQMNTCYYVENPGFNFLIDCGASSLPALKRKKIDLTTISGILISHFHGDHYGGVPFLLLELAIFHPSHKLTIVSPPGGKKRIQQLLELLYPGTQVLEKLQPEFLEFSGRMEMCFHGISLETFPVIHAKESYPHGFRITLNAGIVSFSGDTEWTSSLIDIANQADIFICECNFFSSQAYGHLSYHKLMSKIPRLKHRRIVITHFGEEMLSHISELELECANEGMVLRIN